jgi:hypothetical protein
MRQARTTGYAFSVGLILGLAVYHGVMIVSGLTPVRHELLDEQQARLDLLQEENLELTE